MNFDWRAVILVVGVGYGLLTMNTRRRRHETGSRALWILMSAFGWPLILGSEVFNWLHQKRERE